nr:MAG TPA: hypothetical protein [Caudoviricetes sp.]
MRAFSMSSVAKNRLQPMQKVLRLGTLITRIITREL